MLAIAAVGLFVAAVMGGTTGFGFGLVAVPWLLTLGFPLPFVVTAIVALAFAMRLGTVGRLHAAVDRGRTASLLAASVPGTVAGAWTLAAVDDRPLKALAGTLAIVMAVTLARSRTPAQPLRGGAALAGAAGGFLGATTSLSGMPVALLLARERVAPRQALADMSVYTAVVSLFIVTTLAASGTLVMDALVPAALVWLPAALAGTWVGTSLATRLPTAAFRRLTLGVVMICGAVTVLSA